MTAGDSDLTPSFTQILPNELKMVKSLQTAISPQLPIVLCAMTHAHHYYT